MKNKLFLALSFVLVASFFSGCTKEKETIFKGNLRLYKTIYITVKEAREAIKSIEPQSIQFPGKIAVYNNYLFVTEANKGIHVLDIRNPEKTKRVSFIEIYSNSDLSIKDNYLYANMGRDLIIIDINNPTNINVKNSITNVFPLKYQPYYYNDSLMYKETIVKDTVGHFTQKDIDEFHRMGYYSDLDLYAASSASSSSTSSISINGSLSRFSIVKDRLYTLEYDALGIFNINNAANPQFVSRKSIANNRSMETLFPMNDNLLIGTQTGMIILGLENQDNPEVLSTYAHVTSCDPVIADGVHAYVTLRTGTMCNNGVNELHVLDINDLKAPSELKQYVMKNPIGLAKDGNNLLICDMVDGLVIMDATDPLNIKTIKTLSGFKPLDVIALNGYAYVIAESGIKVIKYLNPSETKVVIDKL